MEMRDENENVSEVKNRKVAGQYAKTDQRYWKARVVRRPYRKTPGEPLETPKEFSVRLQHLGREAWFNLHTDNQVVAQSKARDIYLSLVSAGWDATLAQYKPKADAPTRLATVGDFLAAAATRGGWKPKTFHVYRNKLRKLVSDVAGIDKGASLKQLRARHDTMSGGRATWVSRVDAVTLDKLTDEAVAGWRNAYIAKGAVDPETKKPSPIKRRSAECSAASIIRSVKSLFSPDVLPLLGLNLPPRLLAGVKVETPKASRYHSAVNPALLALAAEAELKQKHPQQFLAFSLLLWAGLRRKEADCLTWSQVDLEQGQIHVRRTKWFEPKTDESERSIDIPMEAVDIIREFKTGASGEFVLEGNEPDPSAVYSRYRADDTWRDLIQWLEGKGLPGGKAGKPLHQLRKESGSIVAATHGIEEARRHLGHSSIQLTSSYYVDKRKRVEVKLPDATGLRAVE